jgi:hypothetical protein
MSPVTDHSIGNSDYRVSPAEELRQELAPEEKFVLRGLHLGEVLGQVWYKGMNLGQYSRSLTDAGSLVLKFLEEWLTAYVLGDADDCKS